MFGYANETLSLVFDVIIPEKPCRVFLIKNLEVFGNAVKHGLGCLADLLNQN